MLVQRGSEYHLTIIPLIQSQTEHFRSPLTNLTIYVVVPYQEVYESVGVARLVYVNE